MLVFLILVSIPIIIHAVNVARHRAYYEKHGKCDRCGGKRFMPVVSSNAYKGTTYSNAVRLVCTSCRRKI